LYNIYKDQKRKNTCRLQFSWIFGVNMIGLASSIVADTGGCESQTKQENNKGTGKADSL
jgi:hypothetical protein